MADIKGKTKKKPPPKSEGKKKPAAAAKLHAAARPSPAKPAATRPVPPKPVAGKPAPTRPAPAKAAPAKPAAGPKAAAPAPQPIQQKAPPPKPAAPAPLASTVVFPAASKSHVPPKPLAAGAFVLDKLAQVALTATNLDLAIEFYRDILGLKFLARLDPPGVAFFGLGGGARLMLSSAASQAHLYFAVESLETAMRELKARGISFLQPPTRFQRDEAGNFGRKGTEEWITLFRDPSGNILGLVERR
jgi:methylmalonyl-CoA/ethylmalonyl-CoA epimerase